MNALRRLDRFATPLSLAARLTLALLLVATVATAGLFYELDRANRAAVERLQTAALQGSAHALAQRLDALVQSETSRLANLALSRAAQEFVAARPPQRSALFTPTMTDFTNFLASNQPFYEAVLLLDTGGEVLLATDGSYIGQRFPRSAFFQAAQRGVYMSDPGFSPLDRRPIIWLAAPVLVEGRLAGVVAVVLSLEELWQAVEQSRVGTGGYAMLLDAYGIRIAHGGDRRYVFRSLTPLPEATWRQLHAEGRFADLPRIADTGSYTLHDYLRAPSDAVLLAPPGPGVAPVYYSVARLSNRDWTVVTMLPAGEVLAPATAATLRGITVTVLVVVALGLTVAWVAHRLTRPVPRLAAAADRIASGDLSVPVAVTGSSEVRDLAASFESMRCNLLAAYDELATWATTLERRVAQRSGELAALSELVALSSRGRSSALLLHTALDRALPVVGAEMGGIWLADEDGGLSLASWVGFEPEVARALTQFAPGEGLIGQVQQRVAPMALDDLSAAPRLSRPVVREVGIHAFAAAPLSVGRRSLGVLGVYSRAHGGFSTEATALVTAIGQQIALALENIALLGQIETQARRVAALHERERLAGEIHDGVAQNLGYLALQLDQLAQDVAVLPPPTVQAQLERLQGVIARTTDEARQLIARLHDVPPPTALVEPLRAEINRLAAELDVKAELHIAGADDLVMPPETVAEIGRIMGEALRNARRHGGACRAWIELTCVEGEATLRVCDNGRGFDPHTPPANERGHFGLKVMQARAERIGGQLTIDSAPGTGTVVALRWPIVAVEVTHG